MMREILALLEESRIWSIDALARRLNTSNEEVQRRIEHLEHIGFLRKVPVSGCGCQGCSGHCSAARTDTDLPVFWEIAKH